MTVVGSRSVKKENSRVGKRAVLSLRGAIINDKCEELDAMVNDCLSQNKTEIILDFKSVSLLDSEALELLVRINKELDSKGGVLKIIGVEAVCRDILTATRLINVFQVYDDIHQAVKDAHEN